MEDQGRAEYSALKYEPKCGGRGGEFRTPPGVSANEYSCAHGAQINLGDLAVSSRQKFVDSIPTYTILLTKHTVLAEGLRFLLLKLAR